MGLARSRQNHPSKERRTARCAAFHYADGSFIAADSEAGCADVNPDSGSPFGFWHPDLVTMHVWLWYPNPDGLFTGENPASSRSPAMEPRTVTMSLRSLTHGNAQTPVVFDTTRAAAEGGSHTLSGWAC